MAGAVIMIVVLVVVIPVGILMSGALGAFALGRLLKRDADERPENIAPTPTRIKLAITHKRYKRVCGVDVTPRAPTTITSKMSRTSLEAPKLI